MKFAEFSIAEPILRAVSNEGYDVATPVQAQAIPHVLEGRDLMGCAQTGTGKTAAFALPILHRLSTQPARHPSSKVRCLVLCPTRELAVQIDESFRVYGKNVGMRHALVFGGVNQNPQVKALRTGVDIVTATPGRLLDLMNQGHVDLRGVEVLVLDEADRMLDMGFINDIRKIIAKLNPNRQTLMFSATMPPEIRSLAGTILKNPVSVQVAAVSSTVEEVEQTVYFVEKRNKPALLAHLVDHLPMTRAIVFTRTKHGADRVVRQLRDSGIKAEAIHGNKNQNARQRALNNFKANKLPVLVATDIASRGIDVDGITHVVNFDLTHEPETYVHRIGRTARAGASGHAVSFCDQDERPNLRAIERLIRQTIEVKTDLPKFTQAVQTAGGAHGRPNGDRPQSGSARANHRGEAGGPTHRGHSQLSRNQEPARRGGHSDGHNGSRPAQHGGQAHPTSQNGGRRIVGMSGWSENRRPGGGHGRPGRGAGRKPARAWR